MTSDTAEVVLPTQTPGLAKLVTSYMPDFTDRLPKFLPPEKFMRWSLSYLGSRPKLAECRPESVFVALLECASFGLEPGRTYHVVPFKGVATGIIDYKGEAELISRAHKDNAGRQYATVQAQLIREEDDFEWLPAENRVLHHVEWGRPRGALAGAYAYVQYESGLKSTIVVMNGEQIGEHRAASRFGNDPDSPWQRWPEPMWLKTPIHQLRKTVPWSVEWA